MGIKFQRNSKLNDERQDSAWKATFYFFEFSDSKMKRIIIPTVNHKIKANQHYQAYFRWVSSNLHFLYRYMENIQTLTHYFEWNGTFLIPHFT